MEILKNNDGFLELSDFKVSERYIENVEYLQIRLIFQYHGQYFNLQITDPDFIEGYSMNKYILYGVDKISASFSHAKSSHGMSIKQIARILFQEKIEKQYSEDDFDELPF